MNTAMPATRKLRLVAQNPERIADRDALRWRAVQDKDRGRDGEFLFAVRTTGIYCRPSCPSRPPKRENVQFFDDALAARAAGFRSCKRCKPDDASLADRQRALVERACHALAAAEERVPLAELAATFGLSPHHFHRVFKSHTGVTPREYQAQLRLSRLPKALGSARSVTDAVYESGFSSAGRFYEEAPDHLGMTPSRFRTGGKGESLQFAIAPCSLGELLVAATARGLCMVEFGDDAHELASRLHQRFPMASIREGDAAFRSMVSSVVVFVDRGAGSADLPLDIRGTAFQRRVWSALRKIPRGKTASYADIAKRIGAPTAVRAVAQACAQNSLAVVVPCHRVVKSDGALSGYRWGVERKAALLAQEGATGVAEAPIAPITRGRVQRK